MNQNHNTDDFDDDEDDDTEDFDTTLDDLKDYQIEVKSTTFCPYCAKEGKLSDHFRCNHLDVPEVEELTNLEDEEEKSRRYRLMRIKANFKHNLEVLMEKKGVLAVLTPMKKETSRNFLDYDFCRGCRGWFLTSGLVRHQRKDRCKAPSRSQTSVYGKLKLNSITEDAKEILSCTNENEVLGFQIKPEDVALVTEKLLKPIKDELHRELILSDPLLVNFVARRIRLFNPNMTSFR